MLLVHGVGMNADYWSNLLDELSNNFTVTVIDVPGHGESPLLNKKKPSLQDYSDAIAATIAEQSIVIGHSMGALIALDLSVRYPHLTAGIGVLNGIYRRDAKAAVSIKARVAELCKQAANQTKSDPTDTLARWFGHSPEGIDAEAAANCKLWLDQVDLQAYADAYQAFADADAPSDNLLSGIDKPALFITGSLEPNSTPSMSRAMSQQIPGSGCVIVDGARHMMSLTHASDVVAALKNIFIQE